MNKQKKLTRRNFLGLSGAAAILGGITCIGGVSGYLVLDYLTSSDPTDPQSLTPIPTTGPKSDSSRPTTLKQIDRPAIVLRADWGALEPNHEAKWEPGFYSLTNVDGWREYEGDLRAIYNTVVVHHSVLYETDDYSTMREIQTEHMDTREWADVGYHFGVGKTGVVFEGRDLMARGTHVQSFNYGTVGVVLFGNFEEENPSQEQIESARRLIDWLALRLELTHLAGHRDFNEGTDCPGDNLYYYLEALAESAGLIHSTDGYTPPPEAPTPEP
ncbi:MAG TPA: peptidoglycan recognition family protein [Aggregatilineaceae bacterium]|nr:peptidoglycan recognition family protein [Aggregatilineaceae bacterium]